MIQVFADLEDLSRGAAEFCCNAAREAVAARGRFSVALSGGSTPRRTYELVAQPPWREETPWAQTFVFWGDERCVDPDDPRSNARMAREALLRQVPIPASQIYPMVCTPYPAAGAKSYEVLLQSFFGEGPPRFDLIILGLGTNGHTASLFPGTPVLREQERWVAEVYNADDDLYRLTLTAPIINQARLVVFLVAGADKATVLAEVRQGPRDPRRLPAQLIQPEGELHWFLDKGAAGRL